MNLSPKLLDVPRKRLFTKPSSFDGLDFFPLIKDDVDDQPAFNGNIFLTLIKRKLRIPQIQGIKDDAVVVYCEPLITKEMGYHQLSRRVNKMGLYSKIYILSIEAL